jgi:hypothetical protein
MIGSETQRFTEQTSRVPRKTHGTTGTHSNIVSQQPPMLGVIDKTVSRRSRELNQHGHTSFGAVFTGTRRYWITSEHNPSRIYVPGIVDPDLFKPFCV